MRLSIEDQHAVMDHCGELVYELRTTKEKLERMTRERNEAIARLAKAEDLLADAMERNSALCDELEEIYR
jgi:hypothetical protein